MGGVEYRDGNWHMGDVVVSWSLNRLERAGELYLVRPDRRHAVVPRMLFPGTAAWDLHMRQRDFKNDLRRKLRTGEIIVRHNNDGSIEIIETTKGPESDG